MKFFLIFFFIFILVLSSCSNIQEKFESKKVDLSPSAASLHILFSHNISGETHPCGCRHFPLGGLPQVAGLFNHLKKDGELLYVDTGDTFFPSSVVPLSMKESLAYAANHLALGLEQLGLKYFVPGDQDFALGFDFLKNMAEVRKFEFLISNLADPKSIKHTRYAVIKRNEATIFLLGFVSGEVFNDKNNQYFLDIPSTLSKLIEELKELGFNPSDSHHRLIILSHSGIDLDKKLAAKFPFIEWIIGAHSQSFLRYSDDVENVKIVQVLSKNHYLGNITINTLEKKDRDHYVINEIRDELENNLTPNPFRLFIDEHKSKMNEIQIQEQTPISDLKQNSAISKYHSVSDCLSCHKPQVKFWQGTPHAIAYYTLIKSRAQNNLLCVKCHSLGLDDPKGFNNIKDMVTFKSLPKKDYWSELPALNNNIKSIRQESRKTITEISKRWIKYDKKAQVVNNFANVQCLNCHELDDNHPFNLSLPITPEEKLTKQKNQCLGCHTVDHSPEWYQKDGQILNEIFFQEKFKKLSCPAL